MKVQGVDEEGEEGVVFSAEGLCRTLGGCPLPSLPGVRLPFLSTNVMPEDVM